MSSTIKIVQNDNLPEVTLTLTDRQTGNPIDLSAATTTVVVKFRAFGSTATPTVLQCSKVDAVNGVVRFGFPGPTLDVPAGQYQGEIEISFNGQILTVFDLLQFVLRADF
jgi:hypothetical protein